MSEGLNICGNCGWVFREHEDLRHHMAEPCSEDLRAENICLHAEVERLQKVEWERDELRSAMQDRPDEGTWRDSFYRSLERVHEAETERDRLHAQVEQAERARDAAEDKLADLWHAIDEEDSIESNQMACDLARDGAHALCKAAEVEHILQERDAALAQVEQLREELNTFAND